MLVVEWPGISTRKNGGPAFHGETWRGLVVRASTRAASPLLILTRSRSIQSPLWLRNEGLHLPSARAKLVTRRMGSNL